MKSISELRFNAIRIIKNWNKKAEFCFVTIIIRMLILLELFLFAFGSMYRIEPKLSQRNYYIDEHIKSNAQSKEYPYA
jgi:hypothetical protein